ncbi:MULTISPECIES: hypothetical protein [Vibrio]|uniref:hypothetical protein n=1 Tax=Vibrio TaxID=662 RepID=UPI000AB4EB8E|nr:MULTISPECIES: hypothetical protein [Vibrio]
MPFIGHDTVNDKRVNILNYDAPTLAVIKRGDSLKYNATPQFFLPNLDMWPVGSAERLIHGCWLLSIMRLHTFTNECGEKLQETYNEINHRIGVNTVYIDLLTLGMNYRNSSQILNIIRNNEQPTWVWFTNCDALLDTSLAGWLRSILTTCDVEHLRVAFLLDNKMQYRSIFQHYSAPLYKSTTYLVLKVN